MELFKLHGIIDVDNKSANNALDETSQKGQQTQSKMSKFFSGIGKGAAVVGKAVGVGMAAAGTAVAGLATKSIQAYADYEQLVGGVDTLFKDSSAKVQEYAKNAYKTAGLSANEYMETVTSFSASLLQSLDGDTNKAAESANMAIEDMADNANVFGTSIEDIQNAYSGFSKQNYTMLDNLRLGYGGTQAEMERLIKDANKLKVEQGGLADLTINSYADIIEAIHLVQEEMLITGTTMNEAEGTISGSISMTKAAWSNLLSGLAQGNADIPTLVGNVVSSGVNVLNNIIPVAKQVLQHIPEAISEISPEAGAAFQTIIDTIMAILPVLHVTLETTFKLIADVLAFVQDHTGVVIAIATAIGVAVTAIGMYNTVQAIKNALDIKETLTLSAVITALKTKIALMYTAIAPYLAIAVAVAAVIAVGVLLYKNWDKIKEKCGELKDYLSEKFTEVKATVVQKVTELKEKAVETFTALKEGIAEKIAAAKDKVISTVQSMRESFVEKITAIKTKAAEIFNSIKEKITAPIENAKTKIKNIVDTIKGFFSNMNISFPEIKMPHFSVTPSGWKIGDLLKGDIPKLKIDWYAEAMRNPMIMTKPTVFGYDAGTGKLLGGGEAGSEVVTGTSTLMNMIASAVASQNSALVYYMQKIIEILADYFPQLLEALDMDVVLNDGVLVGRLAPAMDVQLGIIKGQKERGR